MQENMVVYSRKEEQLTFDLMVEEFLARAVGLKS